MKILNTIREKLRQILSCTERILNEIENPFNKINAGRKNMIQGEQIYSQEILY